MNNNGAKVAAAQGKLMARCIKLAGRDKVSDVDACFAPVLPDPPDPKVTAAQDKVGVGESRDCGIENTPDFGFTSAAVVNTAAVEEQITLAGNVFGTPLVEPNIFGVGDDPRSIKCQSSVATAYEKLAVKWLKVFNKCKKKGLKSGTIVGTVGLGECAKKDDGGKLSKAIGKLQSTVDRACAGVVLASAFPGCAAPILPQLTVGDCIAAAVGCRMCRTINAMDGFGSDCDSVDDDTSNGSCTPQCGNGFIEPGEDCDGDGAGNGGETFDCDLDCTNAVCGDRTVNVTRNEQCDDGNVSNNDCCDMNCDYEPNGSLCDDDSICTTDDQCDGAGTCAGDAAPAGSCTLTVLGGSSLKMSHKLNGSGVIKDTLAWKLGRVTVSDFGDPLNTEAYTLCVYRSDIMGTTVLSRLRMRAGSKWTDRSGNSGDKYKYKDRTLKTDGVKVAQLKKRTDDLAKFVVKAKSPKLVLPALGFADGTTLTTQLRSGEPGSAGVCVEANFSTGFRANGPQGFKDKSDD